MPGLMVSEFVVVWGELNWLRDVAGSAFFVKRDARQACAACRRGFVGGWLFRAVGEGGCSGVGWAISASLDSWEERLILQ